MERQLQYATCIQMVNNDGVHIWTNSFVISPKKKIEEQFFVVAILNVWLCM